MKDNILYHYSSVEGAHGILSSGSIWMSDCRFLNDTLELKSAMTKFEMQFMGKERTALSNALSWWEIRYGHCVFSLSKSVDTLSQWRAYGADGRGMALGFNADFIEDKNGKSPTKLVECIYENHDEYLADSASDLNSYVNELVSAYDKSGNAINYFWEILEKDNFPLVKFYEKILAVKNIAFKEEREVRLITSVLMENTLSRVSNEVGIPYYNKSLNKYGDKACDIIDFIIPEIWLGPKCDERNKIFLLSRNRLGWATSGINRFDCGYR